MNKLKTHLSDIDSDRKTLLRANSVLSDNWQDRNFERFKSEHLDPLDKMLSKFQKEFSINLNSMIKLYEELQRMHSRLSGMLGNRLSRFSEEFCSQDSKIISKAVVPRKGTGSIREKGSIEGLNHRPLMYINSSGRIEDRYGHLLGYITNNGRIETIEHKLLGNITADGRVLDKYNKLLGFITNEGRIEDKYHHIHGYINDEGRIENKYHNLLGYYKGYNKSVAAVLTFFNMLNLDSNELD